MIRDPFMQKKTSIFLNSSFFLSLYRAIEEVISKKT